jgi:hypothetical protein
MNSKKREQCELLEKCPFFEKYKCALNVIIKGWVRSFCIDKARSETCARKLYRKEHGQPAPIDMTPTGESVETFLSQISPPTK